MNIRKIPATMERFTSVKNILQNEKYKGHALLQKYYTKDFLTKKLEKNKGEVPQVYVENSHEAIIDPETFDLVQDMIKKRRNGKHRVESKYGDLSVFSGKVICADCGEVFGPKVWHSNDKNRKVVYQCNAKFKYSLNGMKKRRCATPHLVESDMKDAFLKAANKVIGKRADIINELKEEQKILTDSAELEKKNASIEEKLEACGNEIQLMIAENASIAHNQEQYRKKYNAKVAEYEELDKQHEKLIGEIADRSAKDREINRFIETLEKTRQFITEFDEGLWTSLVDKVTVNRDGSMRFLMNSGMEIDV